VAPIVALLTDFGTRDHYVGVMKAVVISVCPDATLIDITHDIPPQDVVAGALELRASYSYFPAGTVFLVVVDPGVGSSRRALGAETREHTFVGPDNGVLSAVFRDAPPTRVVELSEPSYARATVSRTFEGRDRFAPAAGWLARGIELDAFGPAVSDYHMLSLPEPSEESTTLIGEVVSVDRFGNLITNINRQCLSRFARNAGISIRVGATELDRVVNTYGEVPAGVSCALFGSTDHLEIAVNGGSAAEQLTANRGAVVTVQRQ
jgi:S-adenosylmethionine hydrolase